MSARLVPLDTFAWAPTIAIQRPVVLIGRHPECDVRIDRPQVSRRHCCLALSYDRLVIRDLGSRNGLRVNGRVVNEARLVPGDEIAIAHVLYRLEHEAVPTPTPSRSVPQSVIPVPNPLSPELIPDDGDVIPLLPLDDAP